MSDDRLISLKVGKGLLVLTISEYERGLRRGKTVLRNRQNAKRRRRQEKEDQPSWRVWSPKKAERSIV